MRKITLFALAAMPLAFFTATNVNGGGGTPDGVIPIDPIGFLKREPVLNVDITGSTLTGPLHSRFTVYNDGLVTSSDCGGFFGTSSAGTTVAPSEAAESLRSDLIAAGGLSLKDQPPIFADVPLTTVTVFKGATNSRAHTFSYWIGVGEYAQLASVIADFQAKYPIACSGVTSQ